MTLVALGDQDPSVPWPTSKWETGPVRTGDPERIEELLRRAFEDQPRDDIGLTLAVVCVQGGRLVAERYGPQTDHTTPLISWSMAKSITQAWLGLLSSDGLLEPDEPVGAPEWSGDLSRSSITVQTMLQMRSGLTWNEDYVDHRESHCLQMLFGSGADDMAAYAASLPLEQAVGSTFNYSSGTTNILSRMAGNLCTTAGLSPRDYLQSRLFDRLGMTSAAGTFDPSGTFIGSSYVHATARDFAKFGHFYLRNGTWEGDRLLPAGWVDRARTQISTDPSDGRGYGEHWWVSNDDPLGTFWANGYEGQSITIVPALDLVIVRLGKTPAGPQNDTLQQWRHDLLQAFAVDD